MKLEAERGGRIHSVELEPHGGALRLLLDGRPIEVDAREVEGFFLSLIVDGRAYEVTVEPDGPDGSAGRRGNAWRVQVGIESHRVVFVDPLRPRGSAAGEAGASGDGAGGQWPVSSLMPGKVVRVLVRPGESVAEGQEILVVEAMKMENAIFAPASGRVLELNVSAGEAVESGVTLAIIG